MNENVEVTHTQTWINLTIHILGKIKSMLFQSILFQYRKSVDFIPDSENHESSASYSKASLLPINILTLLLWIIVLFKESYRLRREA